MKFNTTTVKLPTWALCYLINGDDELSFEDTQLIENWIKKNSFDKYTIFSPINDDEYFTGYPEFGLACNVVDCNILTPQ